jgi:hypothetical protein
MICVSVVLSGRCQSAMLPYLFPIHVLPAIVKGGASLVNKNANESGLRKMPLSRLDR